MWGTQGQELSCRCRDSSKIIMDNNVLQTSLLLHLSGVKPMPACHGLAVLCGPVSRLLLESEMSTTPEWQQQESVSCTPSLLSAILYSPLNYPIGCYTKNIVVKSSFQIWRQLRQHFGPLGAPISVPLILFFVWHDLGIQTLKELCVDKVLGSGKKSFFRYLQMHNFAKGFSVHPHHLPVLYL